MLSIFFEIDLYFHILLYLVLMSFGTKLHLLNLLIFYSLRGNQTMILFFFGSKQPLSVSNHILCMDNKTYLQQNRNGLKSNHLWL